MFRTISREKQDRTRVVFVFSCYRCQIKESSLRVARLIAAFVRWQDKNRRRDKRLRRYTLRVFACVAFLLAITDDTFDSRRVVQSDETRSIRSRSFDDSRLKEHRRVYSSLFSLFRQWNCILCRICNLFDARDEIYCNIVIDSSMEMKINARFDTVYSVYSIVCNCPKNVWNNF